MNLALTYSSSLEKAESLQNELRSANPALKVSIHKADMGIVEDIDRMFKEIQEEHKAPVDILVSNAGYGKRIVDVS